jgi:hypothetical protein
MAVETALWTIGREPRRQLPLRLGDVWAGRVGGVDHALESSQGMDLVVCWELDQGPLHDGASSASTAVNSTAPGGVKAATSAFDRSTLTSRPTLALTTAIISQGRVAKQPTLTDGISRRAIERAAGLRLLRW